MALPVNTTEFWKERISKSKDYGDIHHSVYISNNTLWNNIEKAHRVILEPYIDKKVLDAGCGYGRCANWFNQYTGVDLSPDFIDLAKKNYPNKDFIVSKLESLPFKDNEFEMAFCISIKAMIIGNLGEDAWKPIEKELRRVAKEVLLLEYEQPSKYERL